jgi:hypothetical protein
MAAAESSSVEYVWMGQSVPSCVPILVEEPPEWDFRGGFFVVSCPRTGVCRAYPPGLFFKTLAGMAEIARQYRFGEGEVVAFPKLGVAAEH